MTDRRTEIRKRLEAATPGEWKFECHDAQEPNAPDSYRVFADDSSYEATLCELWSGEHDNPANAEFIANAPSDIKWLLEGLEWQPIGPDQMKGQPIICSKAGTKLCVLGYFLGQRWRHAHSDDELCFKPTHWMALPEPLDEVNNG